MAAKDPQRLVVTPETRFERDEADLGRSDYRWPDGSPLTEESTQEYAVGRAGGRPSLGGRRGTSPSVAFRVTQELRRDADAIAAREGRTVSDVARAALEEYVARHRRPA